MDVLLIIIFFAVALMGFAVAALVWQYTLVDYLFPVWLMMPLWLRSRISARFSFWFLGEVYVGAIWAALAIGLLCLLIRNMRRGPRMSVAPAVLWVVGVTVVSIVTSLSAAPSVGSGFSRALQANLMWVSGFLGALGLVALVPATEEHHDRLVRSFVGVFGYVFPLLLIALALMPQVFSRFFEWDVHWGMIGGQFVRGRSPIGSGITAGLLAMLAMALSVGQIMRGRSVWFYVPVLLIGTMAILFSLSRSVFLAVGIFALVYFFRMMARHPGRTLLVAVVILVLLSPLVIYLTERYDVSRLTDFSNIRQSLRYSSLEAGLRAFLQEPLFGHGAGQLYHLVRVPTLLQEDYLGHVEMVITVAGLPSAREPHNLYLMILVEYGLVGLGIFGVGLFFWLRQVRRARRLSKSQWLPLSDAYWAVGIAWLLFQLTDSVPILDTKAALPVWAFFFMAMHNSKVVSEQADLVEAVDWLPEGGAETELLALR